MMGKLEVYQRNDGKWAWRLLASNGRVIATDAGQGYERRGACERMGLAVARGEYAPADDGGNVHVYPVGDAVQHCTDGGVCVCGPTAEAGASGQVIIHRAIDGRE